MSDLIEREDAIEATWQEPTYTDPLNVLTEVRDRIESIPTADRPQGWIPCSERLPNRQGYYICTCKDGSKYKRTTTVKWSNGWQLTGARAYWTVLAWMPLPEPWKGADEPQTEREGE